MAQSYFFNPVTHQYAGPFDVGGPAWNAYQHSGDWSNIGPTVPFPGPAQHYGDTGNLLGMDHGDFGPAPFVPPAVPLLAPGKIYSPNDAPPGWCYVAEAFVDSDGGPPFAADFNNGFNHLVGSAEWQVLSNRQPTIKPGNRFVLNFTQAWAVKDTNPTSFKLDGIHPLGVPASTYTDGHYDCYRIGPFIPGAANGTQAQVDASAACAGVNTGNGANPLVPPPPPGQTCGFYDCPSNTGQGPCCHDYTHALNAITAAISAITSQLTQTHVDACNVSDSCIDQITDKIWKKLNGVKTTCKKCCDAISQGVSQSSEDAYACAQMACQCAETHCGPIEDGGDGTPCNKGVWHAYCNTFLKLAIATQEQLEPDGQMVFVGEFDTEEQARQAANDYCYQQNNNQPQRPYVPPPTPPVVNVNDTCDIASYESIDRINDVVGRTDGAQFRIFTQEAEAATIDALQQSFGWIPGGGALVGAIAGISQARTANARFLQPYITQLMGCDSEVSRSAAGAIAAAATVEEFTGVKMSEFCPHLAYALHATCPNKQMNPGEAVQAYLADAIFESQVPTHFAIAGYCDTIWKQQIQTQRNKLSPLDLATLRHREVITPSDFNRRIRELGYVNSSDANEIYELTNQVPVPSDIIRMMVRDADDQTIATDFGTDDGFTDKYNKQLKKWAADQGMPDLYMQYLWRAHWTIPSPGQLFTIYHRLRHGKEFNADGKLFESIEKALVQQDILPYWIPKLVATSFHPLTRVDTRRAFTIGAMDVDAVRQSYWDQGYSDANTEILVKFTTKLRDQAAVSHRGVKLWQKLAIDRATAEKMMTDDGLPLPVVTQALKIGSAAFATSWPIKAFVNGDMPANDAAQKLRDFGVDADAIASILQAAAPSVKRHNALVPYAAGTMDRATALGQMLVYGMAPDRANRQLDKVDFAFSAQHAMVCQNAIKGRFLLGEFDEVAAEKALVGNGAVRERALALIAAWQCEKSDIGRTVPAATLCDWLAQGVVQPVDFIKRLTNIGYTANDAMQMFIDCKGNINRKAAAEALKAAKADAAAIQQAERRAKMAQAELDKQAAQLAAGRKAAALARKRRATAIIKAGEKLFVKQNGPLADVLDKVNLTNSYLTDTMGLSADEAIQALLVAAEGFTVGTLQDWSDSAIEYGQAMVNKELVPDETSN